MCCIVVAYFFFFRQKTAYEMRISDWSSDVCSSDLGPRAGAAVDVLRAVQPRALHRGAAVLVPPQRQDARDRAAVARPGKAWLRRARGQIGRASCRERVCQYV